VNDPTGSTEPTLIDQDVFPTANVNANGTGAADITGLTFSTTVANSVAKVVVDPRQVPGGFLGFVGTIVTGPALVSVVASGKLKIV
jgi:hypothetical protein